MSKEKEIVKLSGIYREDDRIFLVYPSSGFSAFYLVDYPHPLFPAWYLADMENPEPVMRARTYTFLSWVEGLREEGLALGGDEKQVLIFTEDGALNFKDRSEPARHKILDLAGDLYLFSKNARGFFVVVKGGHAFHMRALEKIMEPERDFLRLI